MSTVQPFKGQVPEYPGWFEPFVMQWLNENDDVSLEFLHSAYARDKKDKVRCNQNHGIRMMVEARSGLPEKGPNLTLKKGVLELKFWKTCFSPKLTI